MLDVAGNRLQTLKGKPVGEYAQAWYRRTFLVPQEWSKQDVSLEFEHIKGSATVYVNGREAGRSTLPSGNLVVPITMFLLPGKENEIRVLSALPENAKDRRVGIFGDVWLTVRPEGNFGTPIINTSVREKRLTLQLDNTPEGREIEVRILDSDRVVAEKIWPTTEDGKYELPWIPEVLWSPETPKLFTAQIIMRDGKQVLDRADVRFGFREFWIAGGEFILNGKKLLLKADSALPTDWSPSWVFDDRVFRDDIALARKMNLNALLMGPETPARLYDIADEEGILILQKGLIRSHAERDQANDAAEWWKDFEQEARITLGNPLLKNHPSLIAWIVDVWYNFHSGTANPEYIGMEARKGTRLMFDESGNLEKRENVLDPNIEQGIPKLRKEHLDRVIEICRKYAPEFEYFTNGSGHAGEVFSTHIYHTWGAPRSELKALFERWKREKNLPVYAGEISQPYLISFYDLEKAHNGGAPYFLENGARLFGNEAYLYDGVYTLRPFHDLTPDGVFANQVEEMSGKVPTYFLPEIFVDTAAIYTNTLFPAWRADGFTGFGTFGYVREGHWATAGISPRSLRSPSPESLSRPGITPQSWARGDAVTLPANPFDQVPHFRLNIIAPPLERSMKNLTLIIAGPERDPYLDDHAYFTGDRITKTVIMANDSLKDSSARLEVELLTARGRLLQTKQFDLEARSGMQARQSVSFEAPIVANRSEFYIRFRLLPTDGLVLQEQQAIEVFPNSEWRQPLRALSVFDPEGALSDRLVKEGLHFTKLLSLNDEIEEGILIIGRNALSFLEKPFDPNELTQKGISVLIMEQRPEVSPELMKTRQREVHIQSPEHPILAGLKEVDFQNWSGSYGNSPAYAKTQPGLWWSDWGNRNVVATAVFRRPYASGFTSLLVSGFDLYQTPLLEHRGRHATWLANQLDITDRVGRDPVPTLLMQRMLAYLDSDGRNGRKTGIISSNPSSEFFQKLGIDGSVLTDLKAKTLAGFDTVVIRDADFEELRSAGNALSDFVYWGGRVVYLHGSEDFDGGWLPFPMKMGQAEARQAILRNPQWNDGWSNNDLYWRDKYAVPVFEGFPSQFDATDPAVIVRNPFGSGEYWFVSLTPEIFKNTLATAKTGRVINSILSQNGVVFLQSENPYRIKDEGLTLDLRDRKWEFKMDPQDMGLKEQWEKSNASEGWLKGLIADGVEVRVGVPWESFLKEDYNGIAWYRLNLDLPSDKNLYLNLGPIDDFDQAYFNGTPIGKTNRDTPKWWAEPRTYIIPKELIKDDGDNLITIRVEDESGIGGIKSGPVTITSQPPRSTKAWTSPYGESNSRDYQYDPDVVRMY